MTDPTPGPWVLITAVCGYDAGEGEQVPPEPMMVCEGTAEDCGDPVAYPDTQYWGEERALANGLLLAAAPALLAVCEKILRLRAEYAAYRRAGGDPNGPGVAAFTAEIREADVAMRFAVAQARGAPG